MKNLKKISREAAKQINGGFAPKCGENIPCSIGWCCQGVCKPQRCMIN
ncbi:MULTISPECIES: bacteriocin-like protein [Chryseobacterium]|nr:MULTISPECIES: hypothetical protein [Chryseobacterium]MCS4302355.1 hypothetical protein [Chryseobacterium sp. BIGb0232]